MSLYDPSDFELSYGCRDEGVKRLERPSNQRLDRLRIGKLVAQQAGEILGPQAKVSGRTRLRESLLHGSLPDRYVTTHDGRDSPDQRPVRETLRPDKINDPRARLGLVERAEDSTGGIPNRDRLKPVEPIPWNLDRGR